LTKESIKKKAKTFLSLHSGSELLVLPNIWNPVGARILEEKGFPAVATSSAAVSTSLGYEDGERIKLSTLLDIINRIARSVEIPASADIESGYAASLSDLKDTISEVIASGVVGINIEDGLKEGGALRPIDEQCERIATIRDVSNQQGLHLVINARVDCFISNVFQTKEERIEETVVRAKAYSEAGADCIYPMGPGDRETLTTLRKRITSPINVLASAKAEPLKVLKKIGINRVSFGPFIFRSCLKKFINIADELHRLGNFECFSKDTLSGDEANVFLKHERES
jgi:2-methylisocitrate lyase-like PEP mutase family enzyme